MKTLSVYQMLIRNCLIHDATKWAIFRVNLKSHSVKWRGGLGVANYKEWAWQQSLYNSRY